MSLLKMNGSLSYNKRWLQWGLDYKYNLTRDGDGCCCLKWGITASSNDDGIGEETLGVVLHLLYIELTFGIGFRWRFVTNWTLVPIQRWLVLTSWSQRRMVRPRVRTTQYSHTEGCLLFYRSLWPPTLYGNEPLLLYFPHMPLFPLVCLYLQGT